MGKLLYLEESSSDCHAQPSFRSCEPSFHHSPCCLWILSGRSAIGAHIGALYCARGHGRNRSDASDDKIVMRELRDADRRSATTNTRMYQRAMEPTNWVYVRWIRLLNSMMNDDDECGGVRCNIILNKIWSSKIQAAFLQLGSK